MAGIFVADGVEDEAFAGVEGVAEAPFLPVDFAVFDVESGAGDLRDGEWGGREAEGRVEERGEFGGVVGDGDVTIGIEGSSRTLPVVRFTWATRPSMGCA